MCLKETQNVEFNILMLNGTQVYSQRTRVENLADVLITYYKTVVCQETQTIE